MKKPLLISVLTISDTRSLETDQSGAKLKSMIIEDGHNFHERLLCRDDVDAIRRKISDSLTNSCLDVIITTGGTGLMPRDVTYEAVSPLLAKHIDGFSVIFHKLSYDKIATSTIQSRAFAGIVEGRVIFCLPGSPGAVVDAYQQIVKFQLDSTNMPCNLVDILESYSRD